MKNNKFVNSVQVHYNVLFVSDPTKTIDDSETEEEQDILIDIRDLCIRENE
jgi:hypothetical protein